MHRLTSKSFVTAALLAFSAMALAQEAATPNPKDTEVWAPVPPVVTPGATVNAPPSDAIILFDGKNLDEWVSAQDHSPARWFVRAGAMVVNKTRGVGNIETKRKFKDYQLHIEWRIPGDHGQQPGARQQRHFSGVDRPG